MSKRKEIIRLFNHDSKPELYYVLIQCGNILVSDWLIFELYALKTLILFNQNSFVYRFQVQNINH